ncbi:hypothetical protein RHGRI_021563 [Rhododendron griersonianum]|uniref:Uncharacterized protein n=1 Tax=Rhododendron griersonianum TaxID=479676 RepID=A0AAV6JQV7_9ERIC|nr:hypothetical protein RHGRI_021563 [Rhododendron griersonianum]
MAKPHAVIVPHPAQGHMNPMLKVAKLLYQKGFFITFVINEFNKQRLLRACGSAALDGLPSFRFAAISEGLPVHEEDRLQDALVHCEALSRDAPLPFFRQLVEDLRSSADVPPITCIVCDGVMSFPLKVAKELDVPCALFWTPSACGFLCYSYFRTLVEKGLTPLKDQSCLTNGYLDTIVDFIPAMEGIRLRDLPNFVRTTNPDDIMFNFSINETDKAYKGSAIILNTIEDLERGALDTLSKMFPPHWGLGLEITDVKRAEVERLVRELMVGESGKKMKSKAMEWKKVVEDVTAPAGSSYVNFDMLVNEVLLSKFRS